MGQLVAEDETSGLLVVRKMLLVTCMQAWKYAGWICVLYRLMLAVVLPLPDAGGSALSHSFKFRSVGTEILI